MNGEWKPGPPTPWPDQVDEKLAKMQESIASMLELHGAVFSAFLRMAGEVEALQVRLALLEIEIEKK